MPLPFYGPDNPIAGFDIWHGPEAVVLETSEYEYPLTPTEARAMATLLIRAANEIDPPPAKAAPNA